MTAGIVESRYELVNIQMGYVVVEHDLFSRSTRTTFSPEPPPLREEYREGAHTWRASVAGQSFRFDVRNASTGEVVRFRELLGLVYYACCKPDSEIRRIGEIAHESNISIYVAVLHETGEKTRPALSDEKIRILNLAFNQRLLRKDKKILILPDLFGLHRTLSYGEIMIDFGLTSMEAEI